MSKPDLKKLAEGMKGWEMDACFSRPEDGLDWKVGRIDEDDNLWPLLTVDTEQYDQPEAAPMIAEYYAAANPKAVLELIDQRDALVEAMNEICRATPLGSEAFGIATLVLGEMDVLQEDQE